MLPPITTACLLLVVLLMRVLLSILCLAIPHCVQRIEPKRYDAVTDSAMPRFEKGQSALRKLPLPIRRRPEYNCLLCR